MAANILFLTALIEITLFGVYVVHGIYYYPLGPPLRANTWFTI